MAVDASVISEEVEVSGDPTAGRPDATAGLPEGVSALDMMREALQATTPPEPEPETPEPEHEGQAPKTETAEAPKTDGKPSRRAKTVEREVGKVLTESEQRIADAEARATAAEARAADLEAKANEAAASGDAAKEDERLQKLQAEYSEWIGTPEQYASAQRLSRMDPDAPEWDFDKHKEAVANLETWDGRRKWAGILTPNAEAVGEQRAHASIAKDFIETLSADLPESARETYRKHPGGIPGAVRFYAETVYAPKIEELEATIAERDAEIELLRASGSGGRSPAPGGPATPAAGRIDYSRMTPEEMMQHELREQARQAARGRR